MKKKLKKKQEISNELNQYFSFIGEKLSQDIQTSTMSPVQAIKRTHTSFKLKQITPKQVYNLLVSLPNGKANGIDMIPNKMLKISARVTSSSLTDIFNCCTSMNIFPDDLKVAKVVPIFKAGTKDDPGNYRDPFPSYLLLLGYLKSLHMINCIIISVQTIYWVNSSGVLEKCIQQY